MRIILSLIMSTLKKKKSTFCEDVVVSSVVFVLLTFHFPQECAWWSGPQVLAVNRLQRSGAERTLCNISTQYPTRAAFTGGPSRPCLFTGNVISTEAGRGMSTPSGIPHPSKASWELFLAANYEALNNSPR